VFLVFCQWLFHWTSSPTPVFCSTRYVAWYGVQLNWLNKLLRSLLYLYSISKHSSRPMLSPKSSCLWVTFKDVGDIFFKMSSCFKAQSLPSFSRFCRSHKTTVSELGWLQHFSSNRWPWFQLSPERFYVATALDKFNPATTHQKNWSNYQPSDTVGFVDHFSKRS